MHRGLELVWCDGAAESLDAALDQFAKKKADRSGLKRQKLEDHIEALLDRFEEQGPSSMPAETLRDEGDLPNGSRFWAIRDKEIRIYIWYSKRHPGKAYVSHCVFKTWRKLRREDVDRVNGNYQTVEGDTA